MADRFYDTPDLIGWCKSRGWDYRLRLKGNLTAYRGGKKVTMAGLALSEDRYFQGVQFTAKRIETNIGIIHDPGHVERWIVAMSEKPGYLSTLDYTKRWGIKPMFSGFKSRGFSIEHTHIHDPERLGCLILAMALALYWAVSTGMWDAAQNPTPDEKKPQAVSPGNSPEEGSPGLPEASAAS